MSEVRSQSRGIKRSRSRNDSMPPLQPAPTQKKTHAERNVYRGNTKSLLHAAAVAEARTERFKEELDKSREQVKIRAANAEAKEEQIALVRPQTGKYKTKLASPRFCLATTSVKTTDSTV
eukprot:gene11309-3380_t